MRRPLRNAVALVLSALTLTTLGMASAPQAQAQEPTDSLEVILAFDASVSMRPAIDAAKVAAIEFVAAMPPDVRIGLETFADQVTVLAPPTTDRALLVAQIGSIVADGDTALYDVVVGAGARFTPTAEHKVLVVLSDGKDEGKLGHPGRRDCCSAGHQRRDNQPDHGGDRPRQPHRPRPSYICRRSRCDVRRFCQSRQPAR